MAPSPTPSLPPQNRPGSPRGSEGAVGSPLGFRVSHIRHQSPVYFVRNSARMHAEMQTQSQLPGCPALGAEGSRICVCVCVCVLHRADPPEGPGHLKNQAQDILALQPHIQYSSSILNSLKPTTVYPNSTLAPWPGMLCLLPSPWGTPVLQASVQSYLGCPESALFPVLPQLHVPSLITFTRLY